MAKVSISRKAIEDLDGIWEYTVRKWSEEQAVRYYNRIHECIMGLPDIPSYLERKYDEVASGLLACQVGHHIVFYKKVSGSIRIIRILHEKMDFRRHV